MRNNGALPSYDYHVQIRDISRCYDMISSNPELANTWVGDTARARLDTLIPSERPDGPNVPLVDALDRFVR